MKATKRAAGFTPAGMNPAARLLLGVLVVLSAGCQPAVHYEKPELTPGPIKPTIETPKTIERDVVWMNPRPQEIQADAAIEFVCETDGPEWAKLTKLWNPPLTEKERAAAKAAVGLTLPPGVMATLAEPKPVVKVKVPAGLDDPRHFIPLFNPPTLHKWELGRRLFYDKKWLTDSAGQSCSSCHDPHTGFADNARDYYGFNTPTLVNCVYNIRQFWNGRAGALEEVVQRAMNDEIAPAKGSPFRHVWSGAVRRLQGRYDLEHQFLSAFGTPPTQDAVGKALATYMRTLLAADSVHDRALAAQAADHSPELKVEHYEKAIDAAALKIGAAGKITKGYRLFNDLEEHKTGCILCHSGREFTDGRFHNLGVGFNKFDPGEEPGRFASLPVGEKEGRLIGAYKTPTLRGLSRTAPYFHDGSAATLEAAVQFHTDGGQWNDYLDPELQKRDLSAPEREALILFLGALDGKEVDLSPPE